MVEDIAKVFVHIRVQQRMVKGLQLAQYRNLPADDAPQRNDVAPQQGNFLDDAPGVGCEERVFDAMHPPIHLRQYRKNVIHQFINQGMESMGRAPPQQILPRRRVGLAGRRHARQGLQRAVVHRHHKIPPDKKIDFSRPRELILRIPEREVHHGEEIGDVFVELRAFDRAADVFEIQRMDEGEAGVQAGDVSRVGMDEVEPGNAGVSVDACGHGGDLSIDGGVDTEWFRVNSQTVGATRGVAHFVSFIFLENLFD